MTLNSAQTMHHLSLVELPAVVPPAENAGKLVLTTLHGSFPSAEFGQGAEGRMQSTDEVTAEPGDGLPQAICSE